MYLSNARKIFFIKGQYWSRTQSIEKACFQYLEADCMGTLAFLSSRQPADRFRLLIFHTQAECHSTSQGRYTRNPMSQFQNWLDLWCLVAIVLGPCNLEFQTSGRGLGYAMKDQTVGMESQNPTATTPSFSSWEHCKVSGLGSISLWCVGPIYCMPNQPHICKSNFFMKKIFKLISIQDTSG